MLQLFVQRSVGKSGGNSLLETVGDDEEYSDEETYAPIVADIESVIMFPPTMDS